MFRPLALSLTLLSPVSAVETTFVNPIAEGADPWVTKYGNQYVWCASEGNRGISLWVSDRLTSLGQKHVIWTAPESGPYAKEVWAPEVHLLDGRWHVYFAASDGNNANHLAYVLQSRDSDPLSPYTLHGPFNTGDGADGKSPNIWAIDMTVLEVGGKRYALWSGWDAPGTDQQFLYIAPMKSPTELSGPRVLLAKNDEHLWERTEEKLESRGLAEGPQILQQGGRTFVTYSTAASWLPTYKLGLLELTGKDPLDPKSWTKSPQPVFQSTELTYGTGHSCFVKSLDEKEWWHVFHAKRDRQGGWRRAIFVQPFTFGADGLPDFGKPVSPGAALPFPSGESLPTPELPVTADFTKGHPKGFSYYGHLQFLNFEKDGMHLGTVPAHPVNDYRSGEKLVLDGGDFTDIEATTTVRYVKGDRDAGILFRVTAPSVGFDAQRGYFAGIIPRDGSVVLGKMDGSNWKEIARAKADIPANATHELGVTARGPEIKVTLGGKEVLTASDSTYTSGTVGLRVVDTHVSFGELKVKPLAGK
ncbi:glycoside hydrolase family 43 protein [Luteolibacter flavescens]|uniref:Glycoside hydrolase family 43 protein n=1 Tax=Luteolibacter flavescens TaxID=1859460 RepID=A0ABT3FJ87_9BACT|nr:glycoside hydrolase family 43 protein [Luteolibacter flavescens]MCW1883264.1 glycoside hydrolase family 43 protein [Luteolibacter flavescens]